MSELEWRLTVPCRTCPLCSGRPFAPFGNLCGSIDEGASGGHVRVNGHDVAIGPPVTTFPVGMARVATTFPDGMLRVAIAGPARARSTGRGEPVPAWSPISPGYALRTARPGGGACAHSWHCSRCRSWPATRWRCSARRPGGPERHEAGHGPLPGISRSSLVEKPVPLVNRRTGAASSLCPVR